MKYKIVEIYHNGKHGEVFEPRRDGHYSLRVGRTVEFEPYEIEFGKPAHIYNIAENDGTPCPSILTTSNVQTTMNIMGFFTCIVTENSIYMLAEVTRADEFIENISTLTEMLKQSCKNMRLFVDEQ